MQNTSLLLSAEEFLAEALRNHEAGRLQFAIVHAVTAAELVLKERLARINPALLLRNVDTKDPSREHTVALSSIPQRLANLAAGFGSAEARLVVTFADWRNQIVHHMPSFDERQARNQLPHLLDFIAAYLRNELDTPLESFLPKDLFRAASSLLTDWEDAVRGAAARAAEEGSVLRDTCPLCGAVAVISARAEERAASDEL
jgi:hypothetical protein